MTDNQFDNFVRSKLHDHSAPVPAGLWDKVNPAKDDDDRKGIIIPRKFRWGLPLLALLILTGSVTGYFIFGDDAQTSFTDNLHTKAQAGSGTTGVPAGNSENAPANPSQTNDEANSETNNITTQNIQQPTDNNNTNTSASLPKANDGDIASMPDQRLSGTAKVKNSMMTPAGEIDNITVRNNQRKNIVPGNIELLQTTGKTTKNNSPVAFVHTANLATDKQNALSDITAEEEPVYPVTFSGNFEPGTTLSLGKVNFGLSGFMQRDKISSAHTRKFKNIIICPPYKTRNTDLFAEFYVSPDLAFKNIENTSATARYLAKKDSAESMRLGYSAGVRLVKPITENFLVKAGLQYTQINEKFTYRTEDEVKTITVVSVRTIIRGPGDTLRITDTSTVQQVGYKTNSIKNRYRSFDIPVTVGYQFGNDNLQFGINAGVIVNISSWYQGVILDTNLTAVPISKGNTQVYKNNIGLGLYGGISVMKRIGEDTQLFFEPHFRYNLSGITSTQASYQQKFSLGGIAIGLRYNLNRK